MNTTDAHKTIESIYLFLNTPNISLYASIYVHHIITFPLSSLLNLYSISVRSNDVHITCTDTCIGFVVMVIYNQSNCFGKVYFIRHSLQSVYHIQAIDKKSTMIVQGNTILHSIVRSFIFISKMPLEQECSFCT